MLCYTLAHCFTTGAFNFAFDFYDHPLYYGTAWNQQPLQHDNCDLPNRWVEGRFFNRNALLGTHLVSRSCCARVIVNVDFNLCRSQKDGHRVWMKVESSSSEAKIVRIGTERRKSFSSRLEKGTNGLSFFALEGKIEQQIWISMRNRRPGPRLAKQLCPALTPSMESCDKHLKTPQKQWNRPNGWQKPNKVSIFSVFYSRKVTFYLNILSSMQCLVERSNSKGPSVTQHHVRGAVTSH